MQRSDDDVRTLVMFDELVDRRERARLDDVDAAWVVAKATHSVMSNVYFCRRRRVEVSYRQHIRLTVWTNTQ